MEHHEKNDPFEIYAKKEKVLEFKLPYNEYTDKIAVKKIIIDWKTAPNKVFAIVKTDLVGFVNNNRRQQICSFVKPPKTTITEVEFNNPPFYQVKQNLKYNRLLEDSRFSIESMFGDPMPEIKSVYIQLISE